MLNIELMLTGCRIGTESPLRVLCGGFVADLEWKAGTYAE